MTSDFKADTALFTVLIPCKNRAAYLEHTLRTCRAQNDDRLEVVVSDDGSTDHTRDVVDQAASRDPRIRYRTPGPGAGMLENFEFALRQAKPGFVMALGGDDGLLPDGVRGMREVLRETGLDLLAWPAPIYVYPNVHDARGQLRLGRQRGIKIVDSHRFLCRQAQHLNYLGDVESPMFYVKGIASTKLVDKVRGRSRDGRFYSSPTPDGYSGIVLAGETPRYAFSGRPFSLFGLSPESQGLAYLSNDEKAKAASESFFRSVGSRSMHGELASQPYSPLISVMTADFLLTARDLPGWPGRFPPIDFRKMLLQGVRELANGLFGDTRIRRELAILDRIAERHGLGGFFREAVRGSVRRRTRTPFEGSGASRSTLFLDGDAYHLHNIVDAAYAAQCIDQALSDLRPSVIGKMLAHSLQYRLRAAGKGSPFPPPSEWEREGSPE